MLATASETGQNLEVGAIARSLDGVLARCRLPPCERLEPDEARADALELTDRVAERVVGPDGFGAPQRRHHSSALAADEERELESDARALVPRPAVLVGLRRVMPAVLLEQVRELRKVLEPDRDVDVRVRSRGRAGVEVDCPAAEQPVCDS